MARIIELGDGLSRAIDNLVGELAGVTETMLLTRKIIEECEDAVLPHADRQRLKKLGCTRINFDHLEDCLAVTNRLSICVEEWGQMVTNAESYPADDIRHMEKRCRHLLDRARSVSHGAVGADWLMPASEYMDNAVHLVPRHLRDPDLLEEDDALRAATLTDTPFRGATVVPFPCLGTQQAIDEDEGLPRMQHGESQEIDLEE